MQLQNARVTSVRLVNREEAATGNRTRIHHRAEPGGRLESGGELQRCGPHQRQREEHADSLHGHLEWPQRATSVQGRAELYPRAGRLEMQRQGLETDDAQRLVDGNDVGVSGQAIQFCSVYGRPGEEGSKGNGLGRFTEDELQERVGFRRIQTDAIERNQRRDARAKVDGESGAVNLVRAGSRYVQRFSCSALIRALLDLRLSTNNISH